MTLAIYAVKCDIDREELEEDCMELMEVFEERTDREDNHFTGKRTFWTLFRALRIGGLSLTR